MLYVILAVFVAGLSLGGGGVWQYKAGAEARHEKELAAAQAKVDAQAQKIATDAANKVTDMTAAYDAGEANAKTITKTVYVKGQAYVANTPAFANPACVIGADGLQLVNSARSGVQLAANTGAADGGVPATGPAAGRQDGNAVPGAANGRGTVPNVQPQAGSTGGGGAVSGASPRRVPTNPLKH